MSLSSKLAKAVLLSILAMGVIGGVVEAAPRIEISDTSPDVIPINGSDYVHDTYEVSIIDDRFIGGYFTTDKKIVVNGELNYSAEFVHKSTNPAYGGDRSLIAPINYSATTLKFEGADMVLNISAGNKISADGIDVSVGGRLVFDNNLTITNSHGKAIKSQADQLVFNGKLEAKTTGGDTVIDLQYGNNEFNGLTSIVGENLGPETGYGVDVDSLANVKFKGSTYISASGELETFAINNYGKIEFVGNSDVAINGNINVAKGITEKRGELKFTNKGNVGIVGNIFNVGKLLIANEGNTTIIGDIIVDHGIYASGALQTDITLNGNDSKFVGRILEDNIFVSDAVSKVQLLNGATWYITAQTSSGSSDDNFFIPDLTLNGGILDFRTGDSNDKFSRFKYAYIDNFKTNGQGNIKVYTDLANSHCDNWETIDNNKSDVLHFGSNLEVTGSKIPVTIINKVYDNTVPETFPKGTNAALFAITDVDSNVTIDANLNFYTKDGWVATPIITNRTDEESKYWVLEGWGDTRFGGNSNDKSTRETEKAPARDEASVNARDIDTNVKRLNDIRTDPAEVGVWIRGEKGKSKIRNYSYDYNLMSGGYDWHIDNDARSLFYGFGITYSTNKCDDGVIGDSKSTGYNLYGSWLGKKHNDYVDLVVKVGNLDKDYAGIDKNGVQVSGDYDKTLFTIATKYGRRFYQDNGFYFEPQIGYTYGKVSSADYTQKQAVGPDLAVHADSTTSHILSFDVQVGKNIKGTETYTKLGYVYDLGGDITVTAPGVRETDDMGGGYVRWTVGAARKVGKNNSFYCDIEKDFGSKVKKPYAVSLGYRHTF